MSHSLDQVVEWGVNHTIEGERMNHTIEKERGRARRVFSGCFLSRLTTRSNNDDDDDDVWHDTIGGQLYTPNRKDSIGSVEAAAYDFTSNKIFFLVEENGRESQSECVCMKEGERLNTTEAPSTATDGVTDHLPLRIDLGAHKPGSFKHLI